MKPRVWKLHLNENGQPWALNPIGVEQIYEVIEKSAYDELEAKLKESEFNLKAAYEKIDDLLKRMDLK